MLLQPFNALIRPHKDQVAISFIRAVWEFIHKNCGRAAVVLGMCNYFVGADIVRRRNYANDNHSIVPWCVLIVLLFVVYVGLEIRRRKRTVARSERRDVQLAASPGRRGSKVSVLFFPFPKCFDGELPLITVEISELFFNSSGYLPARPARSRPRLGGGPVHLSLIPYNTISINVCFESFSVDLLSP